MGEENRPGSVRYPKYFIAIYLIKVPEMNAAHPYNAPECNLIIASVCMSLLNASFQHHYGRYSNNDKYANHLNTSFIADVCEIVVCSDFSFPHIVNILQR